MNEAELSARQTIVRLGKSLYERGYTVGTAGNISVRLADGFLITPTDACLGFLQAADLAKVDLGGHWLSGEKPSKTIALHKAVYEAAPHTNGIVHTHSTHLVALTLKGVWTTSDILPPITPYQLMKVGHTPLIKYRLPGHDDVAREVASYAGKARTHRAVMLERLGPVVWESSIEKACYALEELEETAKLYLANANVTPLDKTAIEALNAKFGCAW
jgi:3-dehydro-4-phosphotetronate decarboxylase